MKLFFWNDPYPVIYGGSSVFAIADDVEEAKRIARRLDLPCAEWHYWSE